MPSTNRADNAKYQEYTQISFKHTQPRYTSYSENTHTNDTVSDVNNTNKATTVFETVITNKESNCGAGYWPANDY